MYVKILAMNEITLVLQLERVNSSTYTRQLFQVILEIHIILIVVSLIYMI